MTSKHHLYKVAKWFGILLAAVVLLLTVAIVVVYVQRNQIRERVLTALNERIAGDVEVGDVSLTIFHNFPDFSLSLKDVIITDTTTRIPVIQAKRIYLNAGLNTLFGSEVDLSNLGLENSDIFLYRAKDGYKNSSVFEVRKDTAKSSSDKTTVTINLSSLSLKHLTFKYVDSLKNKTVSFHILKSRHEIKQEDGLIEFTIDGDLHVHELTFNSDAGSFLQQQPFRMESTLRYYDSSRQLFIHPSSLDFAKNEIKLEGNFYFDESGRFSLTIESDKLNVAEAELYLTERLRKTITKFKLSKPVDLRVVLNGVHNKKHQPTADIDFRVADTDFSYQKVKLTSASAVGTYLHRPKKDSLAIDESTLVIDSLNAMFEKIPIEGKVAFAKMNDPEIDLSLQSRITPKIFNNLVDTSEWVSRSGSFMSYVRYKGRLEEYLDSTTSRYKGKLDGRFTARKGTFVYKPKGFVMRNVNGSIRFSEKIFRLDTLTMIVNGSPLSLKGSMKDYIPFFIRPANKGFVTLEVSSSKLDLTFMASALEKKAKTERERKQSGSKVTSVLNTLQEKLEFDILLSAQQLKFKKFVAQDIKGKLRMDPLALEGTDIEMNVAGGKMITQLTLRKGADRRFFSVRTSIKDAEIQEFFRLFNDFNQKTISSDNLAGIIDADATLVASILPNFTIDAPSMKGSVVCTIRDGRLINFEPLENMSNFLFKRRDFSDVSFAELQSSFNVNGLNLDIDKMEVQSSVLSFFVQGRYSFNDSTSLSVQLPLSNLKKRDKNFRPENVGTDPKRGMNVYLHVFRDKDINSKINIAYDPFKKWVKKS